MPKNIDTAPKPEYAVLVGVINQEQDANQVQEYLDELAFLVKTAGATPIKHFTQKVNVPNPRSQRFADVSGQALAQSPQPVQRSSLTYRGCVSTRAVKSPACPSN